MIKIPNIFSLVSGLLGPAKEFIDEITTTDEERLQAKTKLFELESVLQTKFLEYDTALVQARQEVLVAEATSESFITRAWRPITALVFVSIIAWNHMIAPVFSLPPMATPPELWEVIKIMIGGYVLSRGAEKGIKEWKKSA